MSSSRTTTTGPSNSMPNTAYDGHHWIIPRVPHPKIPPESLQDIFYIGLRCGRRIILIEVRDPMTRQCNVPLWKRSYAGICEIVVYSSGFTRLQMRYLPSTSVVFIRHYVPTRYRARAWCIGCGIITATAEIGIICALLIGKANASMPARPHTVAADECALPRRLSLCAAISSLAFVSFRGVVVDVIIVVSLCCRSGCRGTQRNAVRNAFVNFIILILAEQI